MINTSLIVSCIFFTLIWFIPNQSCAQIQNNPLSSSRVKEHYAEYYKSDPRLVSGDFYQTPMMSQSTGDPFFIDANWKKGSLIIEGIRFDELLLRYDVSSHKLILNTVNFTGSYIQIVLKKDIISEFTLDNRLFLPYPDMDPVYGQRFAEAMVEGPISFLVVKTKNLKVTAGGTSDYLYQSNNKRVLSIDERLISYHGIRTLKKNYPQFKTQLKEYIKTNRLRYKRLNLEQHASMISFCNKLIKGEV